MSLKLGILSLSVGRASVHSLERKLDALQATGFHGVELFYDDLESIATSFPGGVNDMNRIKAAHKIRSICDARGLEIIDLQPLLFFGGLLDRNAHARQIQKLQLWFLLIKILGTDLIHVPTNFQSEGITGDMQSIVADLSQIADMGMAQNPPVRFVYEAMAWGRFIETWEQAWEVVRAVNRPNFGICLDTFQIAARVWGDPLSTSGRLQDGDALLRRSLELMTAQLSEEPEKIFLVQTGDAEKLHQPLTEEHPLYVESQPAHMTWSRNARLFAHDPRGGGFLPVDQICQVIFKELKYTGWVSCEVYSTSLADSDPRVPLEHARRAADGWKSLLKTLDLNKSVNTCQEALEYPSKERSWYRIVIAFLLSLSPIRSHT
jgi:4-hydroxyphenylpyruvate dioxygenase